MAPALDAFGGRNLDCGPPPDRHQRSDRLLLNSIDTIRYNLIPKTSGVWFANEAILLARLALG